MTDEQILKKVIEKAEGNGWKQPTNYYSNELRYKLAIDTNGYYSDIFSHDFAEAFWGDGIIVTDILDPLTGYRILSKKISLWKAHLGWMVLEPEPLKYLEKFLTK